MSNKKRIGPLALSNYAAGSFQREFPEAEPFYMKRKKQRGAFMLNGKIVCAKWASYLQGSDANHKSGWRITFLPTYMPDLVVVFAGEKLGEGIDYSKVLIIPRADFSCSPSIRLDETDKEYIYDAQDLRDAVFLNLGALAPSEKIIENLDPRLKGAESTVPLAKVREARTQKAIDPINQSKQELTIEVSAVDYLAFKQIASIKKKGQQLLFHNMLNLYIEEKCQFPFMPNLFGDK